MHVHIVLFFVVVRNRYCLPTSYQNVGVISLIPTCLPSFMQPSILVRELHKFACPIVMYGPKVFIGFPKSKVFTKTLICLFPARHQSLYLYQVSNVGVLRLVRFANSTRRSSFVFKFDTFPIVKKNPFFNQS